MWPALAMSAVFGIFALLVPGSLLFLASRAAEHDHHRKLQPKARAHNTAAGIPIGQPTSEWSEEYERCDEEKGDYTDQPARLSGGKKPLDEADENEFGCVVIESNLRLREQEAAEAGTSKEGFHRRQECSKSEMVALISLPPHELLPRSFQKEMVRRNIVWRTAMETSSQDSVSIYVRNGLGAGRAVQTPDLQRDSELRVLPLSGFPSLPIGVFWRGKLGEIAQVFVDELAARAKRIFGKPEEIRA
jgi:hypothetical protein